MKSLFAKCGFNCGHCASYKGNLKTENDRKRTAEGWKRYFGINFKPEKLLRCDGCQASDDRKRVRYTNCVIRKCAVRNRVETCAHCSAFNSCMYRLKIIDMHVNRDDVETRLGSRIPQKEYLMFIEPYENVKHLEEIHGSLRKKDVVEPKMVRYMHKVVDFPDRLPFPTKEISAFRSLYKALAAIVSIKGNTYAQHEVLRNRRGKYFLKLLWTFGLFGKFEDKKRPLLVIDSKTYSAQKIQSNFSTVKKYMRLLKKYGVQCKHVPVIKEKYGKKGWLTPTGWLRETGWLMEMAFTKNMGGVSVLKVLQKYTTKLKKKYDKEAFKYFSKADMRVLQAKRVRRR